MAPTDTKRTLSPPRGSTSCSAQPVSGALPALSRPASESVAGCCRPVKRGVWEFEPAAVAGAYSRGGHTRLLRSILVLSDIACGLTFQAAAWALDLADRAPSHL